MAGNLSLHPHALCVVVTRLTDFGSVIAINWKDITATVRNGAPATAAGEEAVSG